MRVKICGITDAAGAAIATEAGADAIGLNFVGGPRRITPAVARDILRDLPPMMTPVALVRVGQAGLPGELSELFGEFRLSHLQVYAEAGKTLALGGLEQLIAGGFRVIPALAVVDLSFARQLVEWGGWPRESRPSAVVLDAYDPNREGGTGRMFRWELVNQAGLAKPSAWPPIFLAGGLHPGNVAEAIRATWPYGVDVCSGVEIEGSPGVKDRAKVVAFVRNARMAADSI